MMEVFALVGMATIFALCVRGLWSFLGGDD